MSTAIKRLPAVVDRWIAEGRPLVGERIALEARCCGEAARRYLRARGLLGPPKSVPQRARDPRRVDVDPGYMLTMAQIKAEKEKIRRETLEIAHGSRRIKNCGVKLEPRVVRVFKTPRGFYDF